MTSTYDRYRAADLDVPEQAWGWNLYGEALRPSRY